MTELRKQFEVLPEIEILLNRSNIFFSEDDMNYFTYNYDDQSLVDDHCIKLAWYAFQEQQKRIDEKQKYIDHLHSLMDDAASLIREGNDFDALELLK